MENCNQSTPHAHAEAKCDSNNNGYSRELSTTATTYYTHQPERKFSPDIRSATPKRNMKRTSSCQALRHAVLTLYRLDDFDMKEIGSGFFSNVYMAYKYNMELVGKLMGIDQKQSPYLLLPVNIKINSSAKVTHKVTDEVMVLKMNTSEDNRPNMLREVQLMNKMSHPNILKFMGVCVHRGQLHALTEYINGGSLHDILCEDKSSVLPWRDRIQIAIHVSSGMQYLHSKGVFHRDLTSRNILVEVNGAIKRGVVADFGLAAKIPDPNREFMLSVVGSPYWMGPECIKGLRYDHTVDVFSYGIVLCEMIARIDADPDVLPRTPNFGLDYVAYSELVHSDCPLHFLYLAFQCCQMEPTKRPKFSEICDCLHEINSKHIQNEKLALFNHHTFTHPGISGPANSRRQPYHMHQRSYSEHSLDFLKHDEQAVKPSAKHIGRQMTKEDPLYEPAPANTNPFASNAQFCSGKKLVASDSEREQAYELSMTLSPAAAINKADPKFSTKHCLSLPDSPGMVQRAIEQFDAQIHSSHSQRSRNNSKSSDHHIPEVILLPHGDNSSLESSWSADYQNYARHTTKQRNLKCAMLFSGLDLIQMNRESSTNWSGTQISSDLESEFQDDLEDVLRRSSSELWDEADLATLSPTPDSAISDMEYDWWAEHTDPASYRYLHPTLVEKRRQLRHVESRQKEKMEQLQIKLEQLKLNLKKSSRKTRQMLDG